MKILRVSYRHVLALIVMLLIATPPAGADYGYTGREPDGSDLIYYRARYHDPQLGQFIQRDPVGLTAGINDYAYVKADPVNARDPTGLLPREPEPEPAIGPLGRYWEERMSILHPTPGAPARSPGEALQALGAGAFFAVNGTAFVASALLTNAVYKNFGDAGLALLFGPAPDPNGPQLARGEIIPVAFRGALTMPGRAFEQGLVAAEGSEFAAQGRLMDLNWRTPVLFASKVQEEAINFGSVRAMQAGLREFWVYTLRLPANAIDMNKHWLEKGLIDRVPHYDLAMQEVLIPHRLDPCLIVCAQRGTTGNFRLGEKLPNPNYLPQ